jgi:ribosomal protein L23
METAVTLLPTHQEPLRYQIARNVEQLFKPQKHGHLRTPTQSHSEKKTIRQIKGKLKANDAFITKADKGNS